MKKPLSEAQEQPSLEEIAQREVVAPAWSGSRFLRAFRSLRYRNYRLFWSGQTISLLGTFMQAIGQSWLVLELTHSPWQLGLVGALQALPILFFSLFGGIIADRWPKRTMLLVARSAGMFQALLLWLLVVTGVVQVWHVYVLALLLGLTKCLSLPAHSAFVVELVERTDLANAIALDSLTSNLAHLAGPALGGLIIALSSVRHLFLLNALSFIAEIICLLLIRSYELSTQAPHQTSEEAALSTWQSLREGLAYVWQTPAVLLVIPVSGLVLLFGSNFGVVLPLLATDVLHVGATGFGLFSSAMGIGSLLATLWLAWRNRRPALRPVLLGAFVFALLEALFALSPVYLLSLVLLAGVSFAETTFAAQSMITLQALVPDRLRGRVTSVQVLFFDGTLPLGYLLMGWLATLCGPSLAMLICVLLCLLVTGGGWLLRKPAEQSMRTLPMQ